MAAAHFFFEQAAQLHFERVGARGQAEMQIQKTVIDGLQGEGKGHPSIGQTGAGRCGRGDAIGMLNFTGDLRETCHGANGHRAVSQVPAITLDESALANCNS